MPRVKTYVFGFRITPWESNYCNLGDSFSYQVCEYKKFSRKLIVFNGIFLTSRIYPCKTRKFTMPR